MKNRLLSILTVIILYLVPNISSGQVPTLGTAANFALFTSTGAVSNTGISQITGKVGTNVGSNTAFGNVNGGMHSQDSVTAKCATDLLAAYGQLAATTATLFPSSSLGNGDTLVAGVYSISTATTLTANLFLNAQGNANAVFIFKIQGAFAANAASKIRLINGALACNVFWAVNGAVSMAAGSTMRGTIIANNGAITLNAGDTLEGRALSTAGAVSVNGVLAYTPIGCGSPTLNGPAAPALGSTVCYALFSAGGAVSNSGISTITGDVGSNSGLTTGFDTLLVTGTVHPAPDASTAQCAADLSIVYNYLDSLPYDIELLYPAQFGKNLVLTPHTYLMGAAAVFTDSLYLNALGNPNAVFVIKINGALTTSTYSRVLLINGAQAKNVYWKIEGAVSINNYSVFCGTIISNNGAFGAINTGVVINGRALTTAGSLTTTAITATMPPGCAVAPFIVTGPASKTVCAGNKAVFAVAATGSGLTYQWKKGSQVLSNTGNISGATSDSLTINPAGIADTATNYHVIVSGSVTPADTSDYVSLVVNTAPAISVEPTNQVSCSGDSVQFSVTASGTLLTYQWKRDTVTLINGNNVSGATSSVLTIKSAGSSDTSGGYHVIISGVCPPAVNSAHASLLLNTAPVIISSPSSQVQCAGTSVSFSVLANGTGLSYQWKRNNQNLVNGGNISGATSATLTINPVSVADSASAYHVVITGTCFPDTSTQDVSLTIETAPVIAAAPAGQMICKGGMAMFTVAASGSSLSYQWQKGMVNLSNGGAISGVTTDTLIIDPVDTADMAYYRVVVSGSCSPVVESDSAFLTITTAPVISTQPVSQVACAGNSVSFSVTATGSGLSYQWRRGTTGFADGGRFSGSTSPVLTINPMDVQDTASDYNVIITGTCLPISVSSSVSLTLCLANGLAGLNGAEAARIYPNPFSTDVHIVLNDSWKSGTYDWYLYSMLGTEVMHKEITGSSTTIGREGITAGIYFYRIMHNRSIIQSGKLIAQ